MRCGLRAAWLTGLCGLAASGTAWAAHPLQTDDTGTQGTGGWQLEVNTDRTQSRPGGVRRSDQQLNTTLSYGLTDQLDLAINQPYSWQRPGDAAHSHGVNDASLGLKWRMLDNAHGWTLALRPTLTLATGSTRQGLGNGRSTLGAELLSALEMGPWQWLANAGFTYNDNTTGDRKQLWNASTALLYNWGSSWTFAAEWTAARNASHSSPASLHTALLGVIYHHGDKTDIDLGLRRNWQHSVQATTVGVGLTQRW